MEPFVGTVLEFGMFALLLGGLSLVALVPLLRSGARKNARVRAALIGMCGLVAFVATLFAATRLYAEVISTFMDPLAFGFVDMDPAAGGPDAEWQAFVVARDKALGEEMWPRLIVPSPWRLPCYSPQPTVCEGVGNLYQNGTLSQGSLVGYGAAVWAMLINGLGVRLFTRPR